MSKLCKITLELLKNRPRPKTYEVIGSDLNINPRWLEAFAQSQIAEPGVHKVEKLYEYLKGEPLKV